MLNDQIYCEKEYLMISLVLMPCSDSEPIKIFSNIYKDIRVVICSVYSMQNTTEWNEIMELKSVKHDW